jgi:hypothetical protein
MATVRDIWVSLIEYRADPTRPSERRIPLGVAYGFQLRGRPSLLFWVRALTETDAKGMSPIHKRLLVDRKGYLVEELKKCLPGTSGPLEALENFARSKRASIFVSPPVRLEARAGVLTRARQLAQQTFEEVVKAAMAGARPDDLRQRRQEYVRRGVPDAVPDPWEFAHRMTPEAWGRKTA